MTWRRLAGLTATGGLGWLSALLGKQLVLRVAEMYPIATGSSPYFAADHASVLYVQTPLVVIGSFFYLLWPGLLLAVVLRQASRALEWILWGFGYSYLLIVALSTGAKLVLGPPLSGAVLSNLWLGVSMLLTLIAGAQVAGGREGLWPVVGGTDLRRLLYLPLAAWIGVVALVPKIFWENFNLDGIEAYEFSRSLSWRLFVRGEVQEGVFGFFDRFIAFAYPNHWFMTIFEPVEATVRLPFFLYIGGIFCALTLLIEHGARRSLTWLEEGAVWSALASYTVVQSFNTGYEPFFNDLAEPAVTDTLFVLVFLAACYACLRLKSWWFALFGLLAYSASAAGPLLIGGLLITVFFSMSRLRSAQIRMILGLAVACAGIAVGHELHNLLTRDGLRDEFAAVNMLRRLFPPTLTEIHRLNALLFPSGILPALALPLVRRKDEVSWMMAGVTVLSFGVLYVQVWTSLHQFTPMMLLPLVVFWRLYLGTSRRTQGWLLPASLACALIALALSLPRHFEINLAIREFGASIRYEVGAYDTDYESAMKGARSLYLLVPEDYRLLYPNQPWGADAATLIHYANRERTRDARINYFVRGRTAPAPPDTELLGTVQEVSVYVRDRELWRRQLAPDLPRVVQSRLYEPIQRSMYAFFRRFAQEAEERRKSGGQLRVEVLSPLRRSALPRLWSRSRFAPLGWRSG